MERQNIRSARAHPVSLGGALMSGLLAVFFVFTWYAFSDPTTPLWLRVMFLLIVIAYVLYLVDSASEKLSLRENEVCFDSFFRKQLQVDVCRFPEIFLIHEGLNQEKGIVSVIFRGLDEEERISLGPLWRQRDLKAFFTDAEQRTGTCKIVKSDL